MGWLARTNYEYHLDLTTFSLIPSVATILVTFWWCDIAGVDLFIPESLQRCYLLTDWLPACYTNDSSRVLRLIIRINNHCCCGSLRLLLHVFDPSDELEVGQQGCDVFDVDVCAGARCNGRGGETDVRISLNGGREMWEGMGARVSKSRGMRVASVVRACWQIKRVGNEARVCTCTTHPPTHPPSPSPNFHDVT